MATMPGADAASSSVTVTATVPTATTLDMTGCASGTTGSTAFGVLQPGTAVASMADCSVSWGSSNGTAALHLYQSDGAGLAMHAMLDSLDPAYGGGDGISAMMDLGGTDRIRASRIVGGKLLAAGEAGPGADFVVTRFNADGTPDTTYGGGDGISAIVNIGGADTALATQPTGDGGLLVSGMGGATADFVAVKYDATGALDLTYGGGDGISDLVTLGGTDAPYTSQMSNGKLLMAGSAAGNIVAIRLNSNGTLDTTYGGGDGISDVLDLGGADRAYSSHLLADGRLLLAGTGGPAGDFLAVRLDANGARDTTYGGGDGVSDLIDLGGSDIAYTSHLLADGRLLLVGRGGSSSDFAVARLDPSGGIDTSFGGGDGIGVLVNHGGVDEAFTSVMTGDGRIVAAGRTGAGDIVATRFLADGSLDTTYGNGDGSAGPFDLGGTDIAQSAHLLPDDRLLLAGNGGTGTDHVAVRLDSAGMQHFAPPAADWDSPAPGDGFFGACLRAVSGSGVTGDWPMNATCASTDGTHWRGVPATVGDPAAKVATSSTSGTTGAIASLRFAVRARGAQPPGAYVAPLTFQVLAPNT